MGQHAPNTHVLFYIRRRNALTKTDHKLRNLLDIDDILVLLVRTLLALNCTLRVDGTSALRRGGVHRDDLRTPCNLQGMLLSHTLPVSGKIPEVWRSKTGVGFLHTCKRTSGNMHGIGMKRLTEFLIYALLSLLDV